jgi:multidrug efflux pump subunit AcrA (membrane-fusion protein)
VGVLPDSQNRWMNPDMKVYLTTIAIAGLQEWLKPGMTAKVEIIANRLADVVYVPMQAVGPVDGRQYCYLAKGRKPERRLVEVGEFNDEFIEIKHGLKEGERVLLRAVASSSAEKSSPPTGPAAVAKPAAAAGVTAPVKTE